MSDTLDSVQPMASVVYLLIPGFTQKSVAEQAAARAVVEAAIEAALLSINEVDRMVLDSPEGAAVVVLGDPSVALDAALHARRACGGATIGIGVNHGPVKRELDARKDSILVGDGIDAAASVAQAAIAAPGMLLISRGFRDALTQRTPALAAKFVSAGGYTDASVRVHELFLEDAAAAARAQRRQITYVVFTCIAILALGGVARVGLQSLAAARQPAILVFDIRPQGEIYLDGVLKGAAPAVTRLQVAPGAHTIEVRNGKSPPFVTSVNLSPGEQIDVKHSFAAPAKHRPAGILERLKFWQ